jgi:hypothetical protein
MGARRRTRQTGKPAPSLAVHGRHNHHDPNYTWQQFRAELVAEEQEAVDALLAAQRRQQQQAAA